MFQKNTRLLLESFTLFFFKKSQIPKAPCASGAQTRRRSHLPIRSVLLFATGKPHPKREMRSESLVAARRLRKNFSVSKLRRGGETVHNFPPGWLNFDGTADELFH